MATSGPNLLTASIFLNGMAAGLSVDRSIVQLPAFRRTGVQAWAAFSRRADLGNGLFYYPPLVISAALFSVAAAWTLHRDHGTPRRAARLAGSAAISALAVIVATSRAAPNMWRLRRISDEDTESIEESYRGFRRWHNVRSAALTAAFAFGLLALRSR
jgi:hypothetical protein